MLRFYVCELLSEFIDLPVTETGPHKSERRRRYCPKISNGSHCSEDNGCEKYDTSDIQQDASAALLEPSADGVLDNDDSRPLKKAKSVDDDEIDSSKDVNNGTSLSIKGLVNVCTEEGSHLTRDCLPPETDASLKLQPRERKLIDFSKLY
ncbi:uncharacterized protein LOC130591329 [Beta vulgaris subsp. vulgaris]|uniref:uncharacterized protein LOC130591329 n=1 Tax=Beta vulgaris subsp. vulgaris TaxID=3555 RepID=UPI0025482502|nr:uncharacterized protein LOC130591329 [Beta vulgaris subsp. vulgaris]